MRFLVACATVLTALFGFLIVDGCGDPAAYESNMALGQLIGYSWAGVFLVWVFVQIAKNPTKGIPVTVVEDKASTPGEKPAPTPPEKEGGNTMAREIASIRGMGTQTKRLDLPEGLYSVEMSVDNKPEHNFIVNLHAMSEERESSLALEIVTKWQGSKVLRVGEIDHPPGGQLLGVESSGPWAITFTKH